MSDYKTSIICNGSKWAGEAPDPIEKLLEVLKENTLEERFFTKYGLNINGHLSYDKEKIVKWENLCPILPDYKNHIHIKFKEYIDSIPDGTYQFFGGFEERSHVFNILSNDPEVINSLSEAIKANKGWKLYYKKNLANKS